MYTNSINIAKGIAEFRDKYKHNNNKTQIQTLNIFARVGNRTRNNARPSRMRYLWTTESTESTDCCQATFLY